MKLSPTEIFKGQKIFFIGGTVWSADTLVCMSPKDEGKVSRLATRVIAKYSTDEAFFAGGTGDADKSVRTPF